MTQGYQVKGKKMPKRLDDEQIASITRHLLWAHSFRDLAEEGINTAPISLDVNIFYQTDGPAYLLVWYGMLFAVCEALRRVKIPYVQEDIDSVFDSLKECRNAVFHVLPKYWSKNLRSFIRNPENPVKMRRMHDGLWVWVKDEMLHRGLAAQADFASFYRPGHHDGIGQHSASNRHLI